jgi:hypothetical protein
MMDYNLVAKKAEMKVVQMEVLMVVNLVGWKDIAMVGL